MAKITTQLPGTIITGSLITKTSELINDGDTATSTYVEFTDIGLTAESNDYNDLDNLPSIPTNLDSLTDVTINSSLNNDFLQFDSITSLWKNIQLTGALILSKLGFTPENISNKQNSLTIDGTGVKYPTVDAVNSAISSLSTPIASDTITGTVKTNTTVADPVVYRKEEVDTLITESLGGKLSYFFFKTVSDVAGYYKMLLNPSTGVGQDITVLNCSGTTIIANFVTEPNAPNKTYIPKGYFRSLFHAKKTGAGNAKVFFEIYKRNLAGTETLLATSTVTDTNLTTSVLEYTLQAYLATQVAILTTDRIVYRFKTIVASGTPDVSIYIEDAYLSGVDVPSYIVSVTEIPDATETVAGKVSVGTQTFGGNKTIVGSSSTVGNAFEVQNLAHTINFEVLNSGDSKINGLTVGKGKGNILTNTTLGLLALDTNTTGVYNVAIGRWALKGNTSGQGNVGIGGNTLLGNTIGNNNLAIGTSALQVNSSGNFNVAIGQAVLQANTTSNNNVGVGSNSLQANTVGASNVGIGYTSLYNNTTGSNNVGVGEGALRQITTASNNVGIGLDAGRLITGGGANALGSSSVFIGYNSRAAADNETNQIAIGSDVIGNGSNTATLGNTSIIKTVLRGVIAHSTSYTVSTLPTGVLGDTAFVTDAIAPTYLETLTGGGSVKCPVFFNGVTWVSIINSVLSSSSQEIEVDFGIQPVNNKTFTITDTSIINTNKIIFSPSPNNATGQIGNDWEVDSAIFSAKANTGNITLYVNSPFVISGKRKLYYQILN